MLQKISSNQVKCNSLNCGNDPLIYRNEMHNLQQNIRTQYVTYIRILFESKVNIHCNLTSNFERTLHQFHL